MEVRMRFPKIGQTAYISPRQGGSLRCGLRAFEAVKVVSMRQEGLCWVTVKNGGQFAEVLHHELDCGRDYKLPNGPWIPESDPRALRYVASLQHEPAHENGMLERAHEDFQRLLKHILGRNGWNEMVRPLASA